MTQTDFIHLSGLKQPDDKSQRRAIKAPPFTRANKQQLASTLIAQKNLTIKQIS